MIEPPTPPNEVDRQIAVERYHILDSLPERSYDDITALMAHVCNVPISLVGLIDKDRHWLKSHRGIDFNESPRKLSFCGHAIASEEDIFIVTDARTDIRFADNPLVEQHGAVGYAGVPLIDVDGFALGTLCVLNNEPLELDNSQKDALKGMARQVMYLLERHLRERNLEETTQRLERHNDELKRFAAALTHDIQLPVTNMVELTRVIEEDASELLNEETLDYLKHLRNSSIALRTYVDGLLAHYTSDILLASDADTFSINELFSGLDQIVVRDADRTQIAFAGMPVEVCLQRAALQQVLLNLIANAVKYGTGEQTHIEVAFTQDDLGYRFSVADDGPGIAPECQQSIFGLFETADNLDREGSRGTGIGLATVSKLVENMGSSIQLESAVGKGSTFSFIVPFNGAHDSRRLAA